MRTLILILELLADDHPPLGYTEEELARARSRKAAGQGSYKQLEEASVVEEPRVPYAAKGGFVLTQAHKDILDERSRQIESGQARMVPWDEAWKILREGRDDDF